MNKFEEGDKISKNFKLKKRIKTIDHLLNIIDNQKSMFWRHRIFPTSVVEHQQLAALRILIKYGHLWEIEPIKNTENENR